MAVNYTWPGSLPQTPLRRGFDETVGLNLDEKEMDAGPPKRRYVGTRPDRLSVTYPMTDAEVAILRTFALTTLRGVRRFGWPHPLTGEVVEALLVPGQDGKLYSRQILAGGRNLVTLTVDILP